MISSESRRDWMHRFGSRLMKLEPTLNAVTAAQHAAVAYEKHASDCEPEDAAVVFSAAKAGNDVVGEAASVNRRTPPATRRQAD